MSHTQTEIISVPLIGTPHKVISHLKIGEKVILVPSTETIFVGKGISVFNLFNEYIGRLFFKSYRTDQIYELMQDKPILGYIELIIKPDNFVIISINLSNVKRSHFFTRIIIEGRNRIN